MKHGMCICWRVSGNTCLRAVCVCLRIVFLCVYVYLHTQLQMIVPMCVGMQGCYAVLTMCVAVQQTVRGSGGA